MRLICLSVNYENSKLADRAGLWEDEKTLRLMLDGGPISELLPIHTCNRTELYGVIPEGSEIPSDSIPSCADILTGKDVVEHLLRVLLGLESMACGESFVVSQVKKEYDRYSPLCGRILNRLFQRSFNLAGILRTEYHPGRAPSIPWLMAQAIKDHPAWPSPRIALIGAGDMGTETAKVLKAMGLPFSVSNRTEKTGRSLAEETGADWLSWERWKDLTETSDVLIFATSSPEPLLSEIEGENRPWIIDMGAIPQVKVPELKRISVDELRDRTLEILDDYRRHLGKLEEETEEAAQALWADLITVRTDTYRRLAMMRVGHIVDERAARTAQKIGVSEEVLRQMAWSVAKGILSPVLEMNGPHSSRIWRALSEEERS
ncbi:hypothetical protein L2W58_09090 [Dethiosulfovibrio sp. F2B]|uniref:NAD(P)-binding domain-containing protein n=1 Tax=Dethiosulfovibrio faecalis TaxID=2720018 RepID=UPI001F48C020|nr:NAD(P)-binding domain-containing protein [Dethiosulfovibrio faecalis]MCF4151951.1 hypothetical protein [Dethiosulfovibrio faecalis]